MDTFLGVDLFCGAGGTSTALIEAGDDIGLDVELTAINHWDKAIETHTLNHPRVRHLCENLDQVNPRVLFPGGRLNILIASPECTHHSNARGGTPCSDQSRATAWRIVDWATALYIDGILVENVPEFMSWGPLGANGKPMKSKKGQTFKAFVFALESLGYRVEYRVINTADYGDPTCRKRFFLMARRGNKKIVWPKPTHAQTGYTGITGRRIRPWVPARDIIDWSVPGQSIFKRKKPLARKTLARIEYGLRKFGGDEFLVKFYGTGKGVSLEKPVPTITASGQHYALCNPFITIMKGQSKSKSVQYPLPTLTTKPHLYLCEPFLVGIDHAGAGRRHVRSLEKPAPTLVTQQNYALIEPFLIKYFGTGTAQSLDQPLGTVTTKDRFALVEFFRDTPGLDILLRMLQPHELALAQSFPRRYRFAGTKGDVVRQIGNAVPRRTAKALITALLPEPRKTKAPCRVPDSQCMKIAV